MLNETPANKNNRLLGVKQMVFKVTLNGIYGYINNSCGHTHGCTYTNTYMHISMWLDTHMYTHIHVYIYIDTHTYIYTQIHVSCVHMHKHKTHTFTNKYTHRDTHIYTNIHMFTSAQIRQETCFCCYMSYSFLLASRFFYMHHPTDRIEHTTAFVTPVVEHRLEREIAQWVHHEG